MINRYTSLRPAVYNPLSLQEMAYAPTIMRQRHDAALENLAATQAAAQQYDVLDPYGEVASQLIEPLSQELTTLSSDLASKGVRDSNAIKRVMDLRGKQTQLFSPRGGIGQLQAATQSYRDRAGQIKEFFKDTPEIANFYLNQLRPGSASLQDGKLSVGNIQDVNYVKHINEADILERAQQGADRLNPSELFKGTELENLGQINFTDLYKISKGEGVTAQRAQQAISGLIGQEDINSIVQYGQVQGLAPEQALQQFQNKLDNLAQSSAYYKTDDKYFQIENPYLKNAFERQNEDGTFTPIIPGVAQQTKAYSPFANIKFKKDGTRDYTNRDIEFAANKQGFDYTNKPRENSTEKAKDDVLLAQYRSNPQFTGKSDKEIIDTVNKFYENIGVNYTDVYGVSTGVNDAHINLYKGRLDQYQVLNPEGEMVDFKDTGLFGGTTNPIDYSTLEMVGVTNKFGAGTMNEMRYKEDKDDKEYKTIFVEPTKPVSAASIKSRAIDEMIVNNEPYKELGYYSNGGIQTREVSVPNYSTGRIDVIVVPADNAMTAEQLSKLSKEQINQLGGGIMDANNIIQREVETGLKALTTKGTQYIKNTERK